METHEIIRKAQIWFSKKTGYRFWYSVKFEYRSKDGTLIFDFTNHVGMAAKCDILNRREVCATNMNFMKMKGVPKSALRNGRLNYYPICYLGYLHYKTKTPTP